MADQLVLLAGHQQQVLVAVMGVPVVLLALAATTRTQLALVAAVLEVILVREVVAAHARPQFSMVQAAGVVAVHLKPTFLVPVVAVA